MIILNACNSSKRLTGKHHNDSEAKHKQKICNHSSFYLLHLSLYWLIKEVIILRHATQARDLQGSIKMPLVLSTKKKSVTSPASIIYIFPNNDS
jgi:hypothetical protein